MTTVSYEDNGRARMRHITGPPEVIVSYPEEPMPSEQLLDYAESALNERIDLLEELVQNYCEEGDAEVDIVSCDQDETFVIQRLRQRLSRS
jgi:hypothetical protein